MKIEVRVLENAGKEFETTFRAYKWFGSGSVGVF